MSVGGPLGKVFCRVSMAFVARDSKRTQSKSDCRTENAWTAVANVLETETATLFWNPRSCYAVSIDYARSLDAFFEAR